MMRSCGLQVTARPGHERSILEADDSRRRSQHWNHSEYLSAIGQNWQEAVREKVAAKNQYMIKSKLQEKNS
ncbi:hypothetical protein GCM10023187_44030 [Nibrella viscosa]|uniref:Uncharacterized protein n=1 Tax=Nibrella viscosa TaxID=1084524 RepID=A0ABP8KS33_9BACT